MHFQVHLMIATSLSMITTFIFYCILSDVPPSHSFFQKYVINLYHDYGLVLRCFINKE
jgi:hypothetical protein